MSIAEQRRRATEIEILGRQRRLTGEELAEYDSLAHCSYMRHWRAQQAEKYGRDWASNAA